MRTADADEAKGLTAIDPRLRLCLTRSVFHRMTGLPVRASVLIITKRDPKYLSRCVESLVRQTFEDFEIVIVSPPLSQSVKTPFTGVNVRFVEQDARGVGYARNAGLNASKGELIACIDDDCEADPDWLSSLVKAMDDSGVGAAGGTDIRRSDGAVEFYHGVVDTSSGLPVMIVRGPPPPHSMPYICGNNAAYRRKVLQSIGGFDVFYAFGYEDVDVSVRIQLGEYAIRFVDSAIIVHEGAAHTGRQDVLEVERNRLYFVFKNFGSAKRTLSLLSELAKAFLKFRILRPPSIFLARGRVTMICESFVGSIIGVFYGILATTRRQSRNNCFRDKKTLRAATERARLQQR